MKKVYPDKSVMRHWPKELCVDCNNPTRYWVARGKYPLCPKCAKKPKAGHGARAYLERMGQ